LVYRKCLSRRCNGPGSSWPDVWLHTEGNRSSASARTSSGNCYPGVITDGRSRTTSNGCDREAAVSSASRDIGTRSGKSERATIRLIDRECLSASGYRSGSCRAGVRLNVKKDCSIARSAGSSADRYPGIIAYRCPSTSAI